MKATILLALTSIVFCSCATLINEKSKRLTIITNEPCKVIIKKEVSQMMTTRHDVAVARSKDSLEIIASTVNNIKIVKVKSRNSLAYWLNIYYPILWPGFLIDRKNPKRYTYPQTIYIDLNEKNNNYLTYEPFDTIYSKYNNIIKINPLKTVSLINSGLEVSFEKRFSKYFTTQLSANYLFPSSVWDGDNDYKPNHILGFQVALEEKLYLRGSAPLGPYISLECSYLRNQYKDIWNFGKANIRFDSIYNYTNYADTFGVRKQTLSFNFKFGYQYVFKRFSIDMYVGLGARYKNVVHFDRIKPDDEMEIPRHPNVYYITNMEGRYWTISFPLNVRIGWAF